MGRGIFNRPLTFSVCFSLLLLFQIGIGIYLSGILTTLERQYRITSSVAGFILSTSDVASLVTITVVTYVGRTWHRPRIIGVCALLTGLGGILCGLPHFIYPAYTDGYNKATDSTNTTSSTFVCDVDREPYVCTDDDISNSGSRIDEAWALFMGKALIGLANGPLFPIAVTYLDDQVKGTTTPYYIAAFLASATSASIVGFGEGFVSLIINVNWPAEIDYTKEWIGAWWLGFIADGIIIIFLAIPFFLFPKEMDVDIKEEDIPKERLASEQEGGHTTELSVKDFFEALKRVGSNSVYMMIMIATIFEFAAIASFGAFLPKFMETQFDILPSFISLLVGCIIMPASLIGNISSGFIVKRLNLTSKGLGGFIMLLASIVICIIPILYFLSCPEINYAGYDGGVLSVLQDCNSGCGCTTERYEPVCGADGLVYASPCYAGCTGQRDNITENPTINITVYTGCNCSVGAGDIAGPDGKAVPGECQEPCYMVYAAGFLIFVITMVNAQSKNPFFVMQMRAVGKDKTFALGLTALFGRALGFLPSPLYFGAFLDGACSLKRSECGVSGDCLIYNAQRFRLTFLAVFFALKTFNLIFYSLATWRATVKQKQLEQIEAEKEGTKDVLKEIKDGADREECVGTKETGAQTELTKL